MLSRFIVGRATGVDSYFFSESTLMGVSIRIGFSGIFSTAFSYSTGLGVLNKVAGFLINWVSGLGWNFDGH